MFKQPVLLFLSTLLLIATLPSSAQNSVKRSIEKVAGDVYRFQNNFHFSLVVLTDEGVVVVDPINAEAAKWLKNELGSMTDRPVSHLIYSHSHGDHASGGLVFANEATVIAHANAPEAIDGVVPTERFDDTYTFTSGSKTFELSYLGPGHGNDLIAVVVRPENVAFITDAAAPKRLPWRDMGGANLDDWIQQIKNIESLDFDIFAPAHGNIGVKADATDARIYMEKLKELVLKGLKAGKSVETLQAEITLDEYKEWSQYQDWRPMNIEGMALHLIKSDQVSQ